MYRLNDAETDIILHRLQQDALHNARLEEDLLDHFCCYVEEQIDGGKTFEEAYTLAVGAIAPHGLKEIEMELILLNTLNKQTNMKRTIFITGFLAFFLLSTGIMFRTLNWPGARVINITALFALLLTALITLGHVLKYAREKSSSFWYRAISGILALLFISVGLLFKSFYFPGANILYGTGTLILNFLFIPIIFYHTYKSGFLRI